MNTSLALTSCTVAVMLIGNLVVMADKSHRDFDNGVVAQNTTTDEIVVNNTAITTETETHRIRCAEVKDGTCTEYIIFRIVKE